MEIQPQMPVPVKSPQVTPKFYVQTMQLLRKKIAAMIARTRAVSGQGLDVSVQTESVHSYLIWFSQLDLV